MLCQSLVRSLQQLQTQADQKATLLRDKGEGDVKTCNRVKWGGGGRGRGGRYVGHLQVGVAKHAQHTCIPLPLDTRPGWFLGSERRGQGGARGEG